MSGNKLQKHQQTDKLHSKREIHKYKYSCKRKHFNPRNGNEITWQLLETWSNPYGKMKKIWQEQQRKQNKTKKISYDDNNYIPRKNE